MDFDATPFNVTFPADEFVNIADVSEFIPIVDDEIDEAQQQNFVIVLEVLDAVNFDLITITRKISFGRIIDNDGEPPIICYTVLIILTQCNLIIDTVSLYFDRHDTYVP